MPMKSPPHPGELFRTEVIEALELTVARAVEILKVGRAGLKSCPFPSCAPTPIPRLGKIQFPKLLFDRISLCFPFRDPLIGAGLEKIERQCPAVEHFVVEGANIELRA